MSDSDQAEEVIAMDAVTSASEDEVEVAAAVEVEAEAVISNEEGETDDEAEEVEEVAAVIVDEEEEEEKAPDDKEDAQAMAVEAEPIAVAVIAEDDEEEEEKPPVKKASKKSPRKSPKKASTKSKEGSKRKKKKARRSDADGNFARISGQRLSAANAAREMLLENVPRLPAPIDETFVIRSFGQLHVEASSKFSTASALYPVGFCCDRYEFSPVHGRVLKLRCAILDGQRTTLNHDGPIFRVMWGQGIDEDVDSVEYPYDPYANSAPISRGNSDDVVAIPGTVGASSSELMAPSQGMRVKVRFDRDQYYYGTIISVEEKLETEKGKKKKKKSVMTIVQYDDGSQEEASFPDPDITLVMPGNDDEMDQDGNVELSELNGKSVTTALGKTPIEAWSQCLIKLGLVDEIIVEQANEVLKTWQEDVMEGKVKLDSKKRAKPRAASEEDGEDKDESKHADDKDSEEAADDAESVSGEEKDLRDRATALREELATLKEEDKAAAVALADARIGIMGKFMCNPFGDSEGCSSHQISWMAAAVRKEKTKMGSTGNKRKIVTATDLLERNNTFYNGDIEALIEGMPGSEYCSSYLYQANRGQTSVSRQFLREQQLRAEKEKKKRIKQSKEAKAKASQQRERELKRKKREDERDARKKQKMEEEEEKKKVRIEERLSRLKTQIEDRLFKEASFQREKVVLMMAKNLSKELARRRKAAELVASQYVSETKPRQLTKASTYDLPPLSQVYDLDILRIWDFITTFGSFFIDRKYVTELPTLDSLQTSINALRGMKTSMTKVQAIDFVTDLAVALCKPLAAGLTRMLFASLIALNPALQKDFGAAFFNEVNSTKTNEEGDDSNEVDVLLPVDATTWKEIARVAFLSDALGELGYNRQETAHLLRGYRSAGHPNSKEARRLRRVEDFSIALLRQTLGESLVGKMGIDGIRIPPPNSTRIDMPSIPSCEPSDWLFYLHNVKSLVANRDFVVLRENLTRALGLVSSTETKIENKDSVISDIERCLALVPKGPSINGGPADTNLLKDAREIALQILDKATGEVFSRDRIGSVVEREIVFTSGDTRLAELDKLLDGKVHRPRMGELDALTLTRSGLKNLTRVREEYMSDALRLKEEMKRQELKEAGEDDEEDDDDDDDDDDDNEVNESRAATAEVIDEVKSEEASKEVPKVAEKEDSKESKNGDEALKEGKQEEKKSGDGMSKLFQETEYDDFCGDIPSAPELIRRCLAVLRTLVSTGPAEPFIYPVDPQTNPGYYDMLMKPMCMREVGRQLQDAAKEYSRLQSEDAERFVELTVAQFGRNVRLIGRNCLSYANAGPTVISAGGEMLRIFERLLLDWVLAPEDQLLALEKLDDDLCVDPHPSDMDATVLLCDGCEGNFNISRLDPPLLDIPKGDWYCPRCLGGRWWGDLDPRIGKCVTIKAEEGFKATIKQCLFYHSETQNEGPSFMYEVEKEDGTTDKVLLEDIDEALLQAGEAVPKIRCPEAVAESPGYGAGIDHGLRQDLVPVLLNPNVSDAASQVALSSSVFRDSISAASTLLINETQEMTASEWIRLLGLLTMKCSSSDVMQNVASEMEDEAAERMSKRIESITKINDVSEVLKSVFHADEEDNETPPKQLSTDTVKSFGDADSDIQADKSSQRAIPVPSSGKHDGSTVVVEASAVEVVDAMEVEAVPSKEGVAYVEAETGSSTEEEFKATRVVALNEKAKRQKKREDNIAAFVIKNQLRSTVASFEKDNITQVIECTLATKGPGLSFSASRCRGTACDFCGLSDVALGTNLVRVPNDKEWDEIITHASRSRRTHLVADLRNHQSETSENSRSRDKKLMKLTIRVGDGLVSDEQDDLYFDQVDDGGMLEFLPRNPEGFQSELLFRYDSELPFVTGSLTAHECCAIAAHNARKIKVVEKFKDRQAELAELEEGTSCGRTLEVGSDGRGRSYWCFHSDPGSLFVRAGRSSGNPFPDKWHRYSEPETIASVIVSLGKDPIVPDLKRTFAMAADLIKSGRWSEMLLKRHFKLKKVSEEDEDSMEVEEESDVEKEEPFEEGELVLVESKCGKLLWDGKVIGVSKSTKERKIQGYRVTYKNWSSRFDEWVTADRIIEPSENNKQVQEEMLDDFASSRDGLPSALDNMRAKAFLRARDRARGSLPLPDFAVVSQTGTFATAEEKIFGTMKAALLAIEAALPIGSVHHTEKGAWRPEFAEQWRLMVQQSTGPWNLMRCVILLEDTISEDWIKPEIGHLRSCLPSRWKALDEASTSSLAIRIILLDRGILYDHVDKKRYKSKSKK